MRVYTHRHNARAQRRQGVSILLCSSARLAEEICIPLRFAVVFSMCVVT